jgi:hypothetical protein
MHATYMNYPSLLRGSEIFSFFILSVSSITLLCRSWGTLKLFMLPRKIAINAFHSFLCNMKMLMRIFQSLSRVFLRFIHPLECKGRDTKFISCSKESFVGLMNKWIGTQNLIYITALNHSLGNNLRRFGKRVL